MPVKNKYGYWNNPTDGLPVLKAALDKLAEIAMTKQDGSGEQWRIAIGSGWRCEHFYRT